MALIDLKTNLKNLKFGNDILGGGSTSLPYIQVGIPKDPLIVRNPAIQSLRGEFLPIFRPGTTGNLDYPIRGGDTGFNSEFQSTFFQTHTVSGQIDRIRIKRFFEDYPKGPAFIQKQIGLQLTNPKIETGTTLFGIGQDVPLPGLLENTRVYNKGLNTLAQVGSSGTGIHAIRHGTIPFNPFQKNYYATVNKQNIEGNAQATNVNRLVILSRIKMSQSKNPIVSAQGFISAEKINTLGISLNKNLLFQYLGGPGSVYGIGNTTINRVVDTTNIQGTVLNSTTAMRYDQLMAQKSYFKKGQKLVDFRSGSASNIYWKENTTRDKRLSGPLSDPFIFSNDKAPWDILGKDTTDIIKFVFEAVSNDNPDESTAIFFRAFLIAGLTDNNTATLSSFKYAGRGENFYTYQGFERTIGFSFRVPVESQSQLIPTYNKLNKLVQQVYPDYSNNGVMRAPLVRITVGDYLYRLPGFLDNVNFTIDNQYPWDINLSGQSAQLPQVIDVNINFKPILAELPSRDATIISNKTILSKPYDRNNILKGEYNVKPVVDPPLTRQQKRQEKRAQKKIDNQPKKDENKLRRDQNKEIRESNRREAQENVNNNIGFENL